jgi:hypothetical protein
MLMTRWAAACPRTALPSSLGNAVYLAPPMTPAEHRRTRLGVEKRQAIAGFSAVQIDAQVKDTGARAPLGPHPWRPPE